MWTWYVSRKQKGDFGILNKWEWRRNRRKSWRTLCEFPAPTADKVVRTLTRDGKADYSVTGWMTGQVPCHQIPMQIQVLKGHWMQMFRLSALILPVCVRLKDPVASPFRVRTNASFDYYGETYNFTSKAEHESII